MAAEEHASLSPEFRACSLLFSQAERLHTQSLPLRHWALMCAHISNPPLRSILLRALIVSNSNCVGVLWIYGLIAPKSHPWLVLGSCSVNPNSAAADSILGCITAQMGSLHHSNGSSPGPPGARDLQRKFHFSPPSGQSPHCWERCSVTSSLWH